VRLDRLAAETFDCVVSDYEMPGPDGIEFLERVRQEYGDLPFVLFTGKGTEEIASEAISAGVTDYLQKDTGTEQYSVLANRILNFERIEHSLDRMERIIEDVLRLAREGQDIGATETVDLPEAVEASWLAVAGSDAGVMLDVDDALGTLTADYDQLCQLLENLLGNAFDHVGTVGIVRVAALENGFAIEDDGAGLPDSEREWIFERGYSTGESGTGLGLTIVERIADAHGWAVRATDGASGGARFEVVTSGTDSAAR
jgi:signal transduction histidine kinase